MIFRYHPRPKFLPWSSLSVILIKHLTLYWLLFFFLFLWNLFLPWQNSLAFCLTAPWFLHRASVGFPSSTSFSKQAHIQAWLSLLPLCLQHLKHYLRHYLVSWVRVYIYNVLIFYLYISQTKYAENWMNYLSHKTVTSPFPIWTLLDILII